MEFDEDLAVLSNRFWQGLPERLLFMLLDQHRRAPHRFDTEGSGHSSRHRCARLFRGLVLSSLIVLGACGEAPMPPVEGPSGRPVKIIELEAASSAINARYPAVIDAGERSELSFLVGGIIESIEVTESQAVVAGEVIARLDTRDFQSRVAAARSSYANAEDEYQRAVRLLAQDAIASSAVEQRKTQRDVAQSELERAEKALEDAVLRAPFDGVVARLPARPQQTVSPGGPIATLINIDVLEATINLPATSIARVPTRENRSAAVLLEAAPGVEIPAEFKEADLVADATSQTYRIRFEFLPPPELLVLPGMNATVVLRATGNAAATAIAVPLAAIQSDGSGQFVWRVDPESMTVARRNVTVAPGIGETVTVVEGLEISDRIVGAGGAYLTEGMAITPWTE
jgi:RND family efflux transporter MFP subunit